MPYYQLLNQSVIISINALFKDRAGVRIDVIFILYAILNKFDLILFNAVIVIASCLSKLNLRSLKTCVFKRNGFGCF